jgi:hypothetical protein|tara:strand:- start:178 stop:363 length:186 start_codon:yes stop_codon:yes gene_type:complete
LSWQKESRLECRSKGECEQKSFVIVFLLLLLLFTAKGKTTTERRCRRRCKIFVVLEGERRN